MLKINNVNKYYGSKCVLNHVSIQFKENAIYGLFGKNGCGKTTLLNIISGNDIYFDGVVMLDNQFILQNQKKYQEIFYLSTNFLEVNLFGKWVTVKSCLKEFEKYVREFDKIKAYQLLEDINLSIKKHIRQLSLGEKSLLKAVIALSIQHRYILLDEPLIGVDAIHREWFYQELINIQQKNKNTYVITSHLVDELQHAISNVLILKDNKIVVDKTSEELLQSVKKITMLNTENPNFKKVIYKQSNSHETSYVIESDEELNGESMTLQEIFSAYQKGEYDEEKIVD